MLKSGNIPDVNTEQPEAIISSVALPPAPTPVGHPEQSSINTAPEVFNRNSFFVPQADSTSVASPPPPSSQPLDLTESGQNQLTESFSNWRNTIFPPISGNVQVNAPSIKREADPKHEYWPK